MKLNRYASALFIFLTVAFLNASLAVADSPQAAAVVPSATSAQNCTHPLKWLSILRQPMREVGDYRYSEAELQNYYANQPQTAGIVTLVTPLDPQARYKINSQNEYQILNWQATYANLFERQQRWSFNVPAFIAANNATNLNDAQKNFFKAQKFDQATFTYVKPYHYMMEWGDLNHPPLATLPNNDVGLVSSQLAKPVKLNSAYFSPEFHMKVDASSESELTSNNHFQVLADKASFAAKLKAINEARSSVWVSSLLFVNDAAAGAIADALIRRAQDGLDVRVIVERSLALYHRKLPARMRAGGVKVIYANDLFKYNSTTIYHSKIVIVDGDQAIMGGQNMLDADLGSNGTDLKNRDVDVLTSGPVVTDMVRDYMEDWNHFVASKSWVSRNSKQVPFSAASFSNIKSRLQSERTAGVRGHKNYQRWLTDPNQRMNGLARYVSQKPHHNISTITDAHLAYIDEVQNYFGLTVPQVLDTFVESSPTQGRNSVTNFNRIFAKIQEILYSRPNLHLDLITSGVDFGLNEVVPMTEERMSRLVARRSYLQANLNLMFLNRYNLRMSRGHYQNLFNDWVSHDNTDVWIHVSFMHSKIWYFDRTAVSVGSFNFHNNATDHAYESTLIIQDKIFNEDIENTIALDMANSVPLLRQATESSGP